MKVPTQRLFLALWPDDAVREGLQAWQRAWQWPPGAALVPAPKLHVTLHFLGAVPADRVDAFRCGLGVAFEAHELPLAHARQRVWPGGIAVAEFTPPAALQRLHERLGQAVGALEWPVEARRYRPHVTFARGAQGAIAPARPPADLQWHASDGYVLVRSVPRGGYEVLQSYA